MYKTKSNLKPPTACFVFRLARRVSYPNRIHLTKQAEEHFRLLLVFTFYGLYLIKKKLYHFSMYCHVKSLSVEEKRCTAAITTLTQMHIAILWVLSIWEKARTYNLSRLRCCVI